jgi:hypothetical protein
MENKKRILLSLLFIIFYSLFDNSLWAFDVGLTLDQNVNYSGVEKLAAIPYKGLAIPRLSGLMGDIGEFYFSAGINFQNNPFGYVPELLRTELFWSQRGMELSIGRMSYSDPLGFIASGLFDGERFSYNTETGTFSFGAWYTGFIYKKRITIEMTDDDKKLNDTALDYNEFTSSYFAPRRVLAALEWEHQGLAERVYARFSFLSQFDFTGAELYSQYITGKMIVPFKFFSVSFGGCLELMEISESKDTAFAAELGAAWRTAFQGISLLARYSSAKNASMADFNPVTTNPQGQIIAKRLSGLSMASLNYTAQLHPTFTISFTPSYFFLSDFNNTSGYLLGPEFFGAFYWSPLPDINVNLGGGTFLPSFGNVGGKTLWRVELNLILSML